MFPIGPDKIYYNIHNFNPVREPRIVIRKEVMLVLKIIKSLMSGMERHDEKNDGILLQPLY